MKLFLKNQKIVILFLIFIFLFLFYPFFVEIKTQIKIKRWQESQKIQEEKIKKKWEKIYQTDNQKAKKRDQMPDEITKTVTRGSFIFNLIFVKPKNLSYQTIQSFLKTFLSEKKYFSVNYIKDYYQKEAKKYSITDFYLTINHFGPFDIDNLPYLGDIFNPWYKDPFSELKIKDAFKEIIKNNNLSSDLKNTFYFFIYFDPSVEKQEKIVDYSFYDYKKFRSFADKYAKKAYINVYDFSPLFAKELVTIIIHESLHLFGASDKYYEIEKDEKLCSEKGRGIVNNVIYLPQKTADVMCLYVEYEEGKFKKGDLEKEELVINEITAREIGWLKN
ncbi:MAG: hypothetical protein N2482_00555 [Patescibacteria group bacterium]|nr:hypothetical protein [Patescibacteria group bacterium]